MTPTSSTPATETQNTSNAVSSAPWQQRSLDVSDEVIKRVVAAEKAAAAANATLKQEKATLRHAMAEGLLAQWWDDLSQCYDHPLATFTESERKTWPAECFSEELQQAMAQEKETREPKVTTSWRMKIK